MTHMEQMTREWSTQLKALAKTQVAINSIDQMASGAAPTQQKVIDQHFLTDYLPAKGLDPYQQPEQVGALVARMNVAPADLKNNMSTMLINPNDPAGQKVALRFYDLIKNAYNGDDAAAKQHMSADAQTVFDLIEQGRSTAGTDPGALDNVIQRQALGNNASAAQIREYLAEHFGMQVRPNHLGMALQRHRRAGRLQEADGRWSITAPTPS